MQLPLIAFRGKLKELGWDEASNISIVETAADGDSERVAANASAIISQRPAVIVSMGTPGLMAIRQHTRSVPVVFTHLADPARRGLIESLARPGGNETGVTNFEFSIGGKWLDLLLKLDPRISRVVLLANPANGSAVYFSTFIEEAARSLPIGVATTLIRNVTEIEPAIVSVAQLSHPGLIILPDGLVTAKRDLIISLTDRYRVPTMYPFRTFSEGGGLISYGLDTPEVYRLAATYVDKILRGTKPSELPVQAPTKFELVINLRTAKSLGLNVPDSLLLLADEVIE